MPRPPSSRTAVTERLEDRRLFSGIMFSHHVLTLGGSHTAPNTITFGLTPDKLSVVATVSFPTKKGVQTYSKTEPLSAGIKQINVMGGNGADLVTVDQTNGSFPIKTLINVGAGNDTVLAGDEPDRINGAAGNDSLVAGGGNNTVYGGTGDDTITSGSGNDYLNGGVGHDVINSGDGNDTLADAVGPNTLYGGAGDDVFVVAVLSRNVNNYDSAKDRVIIVNPLTDSGTSTASSILGALFPISTLF